MPELCRFRGIVIRIHPNDHPPAHFHVVYGGVGASFKIENMDDVDGNIPPRIRQLVTRWAALHQDELRDAWNKVMQGERAGRIDPLP